MLLANEAGLAKARREAQEQGLAEGLARGQAEVLRHQLTVKFGSLPAEVTSRLASATSAELLRWSERVLSVETLAGIFESEAV